MEDEYNYDDIFPDGPVADTSWNTQENYFDAPIQNTSGGKSQTENDSHSAIFEDNSVPNDNIDLIPNSKSDVPNSNTNVSDSNIDSVPDAINKASVINNSAKNKRQTRLPMARIKNIMKMDPDVEDASMYAVYAVTRATELVVQAVALEAYKQAVKSNKKTITKKDLDTTVETVDCLCFLDGALDF